MEDVIPLFLAGRRNEVQNVVVFLGNRQDILNPHPHFVVFILQSKGGILSKACDYIQELRQSNHRLSEELQGLDQLQLDNDVLRQQVRPPALRQCLDPWSPPTQCVRVPPLFPVDGT